MNDTSSTEILSTAAPDQPSRRIGTRRLLWLTAAAVVVVIVGIGVVVSRSHRHGMVTNGALVADNGSRLVVLAGHLDHLPQHVAPFSTVQFIRDGSALVYESRSGGLESVDLTSGNSRPVTQCGPDVCPFARVSPDGSRVAVSKHAAGRYGVQVREPASGETAFLPTKGPVSWLQWSPDGRSLALTGRRGVSVMDPNSGEVRMVYRYPAPSVHSLPLSWSPDGATLAFLNPRPVKRPRGAADWTLTTVDLDGTRVRALRDVDGCYCVGIAPPQVAWSPDGREIAVSVIRGHGGNASAGGVYSIHPDGTGFTLISSGVVASHLAWEPLPQH